MRPPDIYERFLKELLDLVYQLRGEGNLLLPSERDIGGRFGVSRITVRKALERLCADNLIWRDKKATRIYPLKKQRGKYIFCAATFGRNHPIILTLYRRMWDLLQRKCREASMEMELVLLNYQEPEVPMEKLRAADAVFLGAVSGKLLSIFDDSQIPLVVLDPSNVQPGRACLTMDDRQAGIVAAECLYRAGCRKPVVLNPRNPAHFQPFCHRREGFTDYFRKHGIGVEILNFQDYGMDLRRYLYETAGAAARLPDLDYDGLFLLTDEWCDVLLWDLFQMPGVVPDKIRVVAFDGCGAARLHLPVLTTVSNGNEAIAEGIMEYIRQCEAGQGKNSVELPARTVSVGIQPGETV